MSDAQPDGRELSRQYYYQVVSAVLDNRWPGRPRAAGRLGTGSDVLGLDDEMSRDHDWGLRLNLFVGEADITDVRAHLDASLPDSFLGHPIRFAFTGQDRAEHHVEVDSASAFAIARLGFDPRRNMQPQDWLSLTGQAVLEIVGGPVFADTSGELTAIRAALQWYPDDLWRYVVACDWLRIEDELPLMSRAGDRGDDLGSRVIAARLVDILTHLAFTLERRWMPYPKWRGTLLNQLPSASELTPAFEAVLDARQWQARQDAIGTAIDRLHDLQQRAGLVWADPATVPFWDRPYLQPHPDIAPNLLASITDPAVRALPRGPGSIEQRTDNVAVLVDPAARRHAVSVLR